MVVSNLFYNNNANARKIRAKLMRSSYQCGIDFEVVDEASKLSFPVDVEHQFDEEEAL